jgi:hypothetical protein
MKTSHHFVIASFACLMLVSPAHAVAPPAPDQAAVIYGRLLTQAERKPVAGHGVKLQCQTVTPQGAVLADAGTATTDERGGYTLVVLASTRGSCRLWVEKDGRRSEPVEVFVGGSSLNYDLQLDAQFKLTKR